MQQRGATAGMGRARVALAVGLVLATVVMGCRREAPRDDGPAAEGTGA